MDQPKPKVVVIDEIFVLKCLCKDVCKYCGYEGHFVPRNYCPQCGHPEIVSLNPLPVANAG